MKAIKVFYGHFLKGLAKTIGGILEFLIIIFTFLVNITNGIKRILVTFIMVGCFFVLLSPFVLALLLRPPVFTTVVFFVLFPLIGSILVSFLRYQQYVLTEYLYDLSDYYITGVKKGTDYAGYGKTYRKMQEDNYRKEQYERQRQEQEMWEQIFREFFENAQNGDSYTGGYTGQTGSGQYQNPLGEFVNRYESACDTLEVSYDADIYQIKLAYRKLAKKYHPDLNPSPDATEMFQKINAAFEFLNDENIRRYSSIKQQ